MDETKEKSTNIGRKHSLRKSELFPYIIIPRSRTLECVRTTTTNVKNIPRSCSAGRSPYRQNVLNLETNEKAKIAESGSSAKSGTTHKLNDTAQPKSQPKQVRQHESQCHSKLTSTVITKSSIRYGGNDEPTCSKISPSNTTSRTKCPAGLHKIVATVSMERPKTRVMSHEKGNSERYKISETAKSPAPTKIILESETSNCLKNPSDQGRLTENKRHSVSQCTHHRTLSPARIKNNERSRSLGNRGLSTKLTTPLRSRSIVFPTTQENVRITATGSRPAWVKSTTTRPTTVSHSRQDQTRNINTPYRDENTAKQDAAVPTSYPNPTNFVHVGGTFGQKISFNRKESVNQRFAIFPESVVEGKNLLKPICNVKPYALANIVGLCSPRPSSQIREKSRERYSQLNISDTSPWGENNQSACKGPSNLVRPSRPRSLTRPPKPARITNPSRAKSLELPREPVAVEPVLPSKLVWRKHPDSPNSFIVTESDDRTVTAVRRGKQCNTKTYSKARTGHNFRRYVSTYRSSTETRPPTYDKTPLPVEHSDIGLGMKLSPPNQAKYVLCKRTPIFTSNCYNRSNFPVRSKNILESGVIVGHSPLDTTYKQSYDEIKGGPSHQGVLIRNNMTSSFRPYTRIDTPLERVSSIQTNIHAGTSLTPIQVSHQTSARVPILSYSHSRSKYPSRITNVRSSGYFRYKSPLRTNVFEALDKFDDITIPPEWPPTPHAPPGTPVDIRSPTREKSPLSSVASSCTEASLIVNCISEPNERIEGLGIPHKNVLFDAQRCIPTTENRPCSVLNFERSSQIKFREWYRLTKERREKREKELEMRTLAEVMKEETTSNPENDEKTKFKDVTTLRTIDERFMDQGPSTSDIPAVETVSDKTEMFPSQEATNEASISKEEITVESVQQCLMRRPMTFIQLRREFKSQKPRMTTAEVVRNLTKILRSLGTHRLKIKGKIYLTLVKPGEIASSMNINESIFHT